MILLPLLGQAATAADNIEILDLDRTLRPDFSGAWEKDFNRSDRWDQELTRQIEQMQRLLQSQSRGGGAAVGSAINLGGQGGGGNIVDLARLAEFISRQTTMQIRQTDSQVIIEREGEAALVCGTQLDAMETFTSPFGSEICGWDRRQLLFRITLPEGTGILHRFSVSDDKQWLNVATQISRGSSTPFNLIQIFYRYDAPPESYSCRQTLSRGNVCSRTDSTGDDDSDPFANP
ncbi:MAG: hypothetical protein WDZ76_05050 [Pseudohongiellaceae bacterium]